jgi:hypothetical protein
MAEAHLGELHGGAKLLRVIEAAAIPRARAKRLVGKLRTRADRRGPDEAETAYNARVAERVADFLIARYSRLAATSGGVTALPRIVPGVGAIVAVLGGGAADTAICMKLQVDLCMCIAEAFGWDLDGQDARDLSVLIAARTTLEHAGVEVAPVASAVAEVRPYLEGPFLQTLDRLYRRLAFVFTRKALERAAPLGIAVVLGSTSNRALTRFVGRKAKNWFLSERDERRSPAPGPTTL